MSAAGLPQQPVGALVPSPVPREHCPLPGPDPSWPLSATGRNHSQIWMNHRAPSGACTIWPEGASTHFQVSSLQQGDYVCIICKSQRGRCPKPAGKGRLSSSPSESILRPQPQAQSFTEPCLWSGKAGRHPDTHFSGDKERCPGHKAR